MVKKKKIQKGRGATRRCNKSSDICNPQSGPAFTSGVFLDGCFTLPEIPKEIPCECRSKTSEWSQFFAKAFMERGFWKRIRKGGLETALHEASTMFMRRILTQSSKMRAGLIFVGGDQAMQYLDNELCIEGIYDDKERGIIGLNFGDMHFNIYRLKPLEQHYPGLGFYCLSLLEKVPILIASPSWTLKEISGFFWNGYPDETTTGAAYRDDIPKRKDLDKKFAPWMLNSEKLSSARIGSYKSSFPDGYCDPWNYSYYSLQTAVVDLEHALKAYYALKKPLGFSPAGIDVPGIVMKSGTQDSFTCRMVDMIYHDTGKTINHWCSGYVFQVDDNTNMQAVLDEIELVVEILNCTVALLDVIQNIRLPQRKPLNRTPQDKSLVKSLGGKK